LEHPRRTVAVRDKAGDEACGLRLFEDRHRPLTRNERLVAGAHEDPRAEPLRVMHHGLGSGLCWRGDSCRIAKRLRCHPVLAVGTVEIAAEHSKAVGERTGVGVEERLLLDRIALNATDISPGDTQPAALVEPDLADADGALGQRTFVAARVTA